MRDACNEDPHQLQPVNFVARLLDIDWITAALEVLVGYGLLDAEDGDAQAVKDFRSFHELQEACDNIMASNPDEPDFKINGEEAWDQSDDLSGGSPLQWLDNVTLEDLTKKTGDLRCYIDLAKIVGPRAVEGDRLSQDSQLRAMAGEPGGGQLMQALKSFYLPSAQQGIVHPSFMARRLPDFLFETRWPFPYDMEEADFMGEQRSTWLLGASAGESRQGRVASAHTRQAKECSQQAVPIVAGSSRFHGTGTRAGKGSPGFGR